MDGHEQTEPASGEKLTCEDFLSFPGYEDDGLRRELIDGKLYVTPSPSERHQRAAFELVFALGSYVKSTGVGRLYFAPFDVILSPHDVVVPDVLLVLTADVGAVAERGVLAAPALVVEILSPSTRRRDLGIKRELYGRAGVREYWIVDPEDRTVTVARQDHGQLATAAEVSAAADHALTTPLLPGFTLRLQALFADG